MGNGKDPLARLGKERRKGKGAAFEKAETDSALWEKRGKTS